MLAVSKFVWKTKRLLIRIFRVLHGLKGKKKGLPSFFYILNLVLR